MGYHVTILRSEGRETRPILKEELEDATRPFPELRLHADDGTISYVRDGEEVSALFLTDGELWAKNPDPEFLAVMIGLAENLGARVRGDEGETYRTPDDYYTHPDDQEEVDQIRASARRYKRRRIVNYLILFGVVVTLTPIITRCTANFRNRQ